MCLEFIQSTVEMACLQHNVWVLNWTTERLGARKASGGLLTHSLAVDAGWWLKPYLVLSARTPTYGLFMWLLGFLTVQWLGSKGKKHPSREDGGGKEPCSLDTFYNLA